MQTQLSYASGLDGLHTNVNTTIKRPASRRPQCICKEIHEMPVVTTSSVQMSTQLTYPNGHDGLYTDGNTTIIRPPSRRPLCRCNHNYQTPTVTTVFMQI